MHPTSIEPIAVYVHTPFCPKKCGYCDFNSFAMSGDIIEDTVAATVKEIIRSPLAGRPAKTVFFGGGTPTMLTPEQLGSILDAVRASHPLVANCEVTSEANPGTVDATKFGAMRQLGFNRLSLGAQSFDTGDLLRLGRVHDASAIAQAVGAARRGGFENLNLDLMFALPGQSVRAWQNNLDLALQLKPDHLSLYGLTIEPNTRFYRYWQKGMLDLPSDDIQVEMYDMAIASCAEHGLEQYEISNFARPGYECKHNLEYWFAHEYAGYGPGAVGSWETPNGRYRRTNIKHPQRYCDAVLARSELACESEYLDAEALRTERVMLGIRLNSGLETSGLNLNVEDLLATGWVECCDDRISLTDSGRHLALEVVVRLL